MSCNGCRVLRKGCNENCILRQSLLGIDTPQAQANATLFVAKFFGRAGLMSLLSSVRQPQRPALFQSLLFEACGRTVNKVSGAVGLSWTGNWHVCESAVETVLRGGDISQLSEANDVDLFRSQNLNSTAYEACKREEIEEPNDLNLSLTSGWHANVMADGTVKRHPESPSEESETTTFESDLGYNRSLQGQGETEPLRIFM